jgi:hypothetical protein
LIQRVLAGVGVVLLAGSAFAQETALEYEVKAAYLYNFVKFVAWPPAAARGPLTICVAAPSPFATALDDIVRGESIEGRPITTRVVEDPQASCQVLFIPRAVPSLEYLRALRTLPVLTVGETPEFVRDGGIVNFVRDAGMIHFEIDQDNARRAGLQISSRLLRLARTPHPSATP